MTYPMPSAPGYTDTAGPVINSAELNWLDQKAREYISVFDKSATGDGVADDTVAFAAAFAALPAAGGLIVIPPGKTYKVGNVDWSGKPVVLWGYGATILCTSSTGAVYKTDHDNKLTVLGLNFTSSTNGARAVNHQVAPTGNTYDELLIRDCTFNMNNAYGVYLVGTREPKLESCTFKDTNGGDGVFCSACVVPTLTNCQFIGSSRTRRGFYYPGTGLGFDASPMLFNCEVMGWDKGVEVVGCDSLVIVGGTYDLNNWSMKIASQDGAMISHAYIGSIGANPALWITSDAAATSPNYCDKLHIFGCIFNGSYTGGNTYDNVLIDGAVSSDNIYFENCSFGFYTRYGINFTVNARLFIRNNHFAQRGGFGVSPIFNTTGATDSAVFIENNYFANGATIAGMNISANNQSVHNNIGCNTEARGEAFVGSGVSTFNQPHGLAYTPAKSDIQLTPTNVEAAGKNPYLGTPDATNIVINFTSATAATAGVAWRVRRGF